MAGPFDAYRYGAAPPVDDAGDTEDPIDRYIAEQQREAAKAAIAATRAADPERAGRANVLARTTGLPADVVERQLPKVEAQRAAEEAQRTIANRPALQNFVTDPRRAAVARDDLKPLASIADTLQGQGPAYRAPLMLQGVTAPIGYPGVRMSPRAVDNQAAARGRTPMQMLREAPRNIKSALLAGVYNIGQGAAGAFMGLTENDLTLNAMDYVFNGGQVSPWRQRLIDSTRRTMDSFAADAAAARPDREGMGFVEGSLLSGIESVPTTLMALAAARAGAPNVGLGLMGGVVAGQSYGEGREAGLSPTQALRFGVTDGVIEAATERAPLKFLADGFGRMGMGKFLAGLLGREVVSEELAMLGQEFNRWRTLNPTQSAGEWLATLPEKAAETAIATVALVGAIGAVDGGTRATMGLAQRAKQKRQARADQDMLERLGRGAQDSQTRRRDPDAFEEFLAAQAEGTPVEHIYVPAEAVRQLYQDLEIVPGSEGDTLLGWQGDIAEQLAQASATGGDVVLDMAAAMTRLPGTQAWERLRADIRVRADGLSARQAAELDAADETLLAETGAKVRGEIDAAAEAAAPQQRVYAAVYEQAVANGFRADVAAVYAELWAQRYATRGADLGVDAWTAYQRGTAYGAGAPAIVEGEGDPAALAAGENAPPAPAAAPAAPIAAPAASAPTNAPDAPTGPENGAQAGAAQARPPSERGDGSFLAHVNALAGGKKWVVAPRMTDRLRRQGNEVHFTPKQFEKIKRDFDAAQAAGQGQLSLNQDAAPVAELTGDEILPGYVSGTGQLPALRNAAFSWYRANLIGTRIERSDGIAVEFSKRGARKSTSNVGDDLLRALPALPAIIANGRIVSREASTKPGVAEMIKVAGTVDLAGKRVEVVAGILRRNNGTWHYSWNNLVPEGQASKSSEGSAEAGGPERKSPSGEADITRNADGSNRSLDQSARGRIDFGPMGSIIRLFQGRDLSTVLHEGWHQWLEELRFDATSPGASEALRQRWQVLTDWFAANGHPLNPDGTIPTGAHELLARAGERYMMEGKAPTPGLAGAFARFRSWMLRIYEVVANLNTPLNDEVRAVFDRMLATEAEIEAAEAMLETGLAFRTAADAGMTDAEFAAYRASTQEVRDEAMNALIFRTMAPIRAARTAEWRQQRERVRADVMAQVDARPEWRALAILRGAGEATRVALDRNAIVAAYGEGALAAIPGGVPATVTSDGSGVHPDVLAEMVGLPTGKMLIDRLAEIAQLRAALKAEGKSISPRVATIERETDAIMLERHGDPLNDGSIEEEAQAAIAGDVRSRVIASEAAAMARKTGNGPLAWPVVKAWAERSVRGGKIREQATPAALQRHLRAEAKAAKEFERALAAGDVDGAFRASQARLLNHALYRAAKAAKDDVDKAARRLGKLAAAKTLPSMDQDYLDRIHGLLEAYDFKPRSATNVAERESFAAWVRSRADQGEEVHVPPRLLDAAAMNYRSMTVDDLIGLDDTVQSIAHLGRRKKTMLLNKEARDFAEVVREAKASAETLADVPRENTRNPKDPIYERFNAELRKVEFWVDQLDRGNPNGMWNRVLIRPATEAANEQARLRDMVMKPIADLWLNMDRAQRARLDEKVIAPELASYTFSRSEIVAIALNMGNASNMDKLLRGEGWKQTDVEAVLARELTAADWQFVQGIWRAVDQLWPHIARVERELTGLEPERIEGREVQTPFGPIKGGYYPIAYDPTRNDTARQNAEDRANRMFGAIGRSVATPVGHTKSRTGFSAPLMLDIDAVLSRHIADVTTRIAYAPFARDALKFLRDPTIQTMIRTKLGGAALRQFEPWLQRQINDGGADTATLKWSTSLLRRFRVNATIVGLGLRATTMAAQVSGLSNSAAEIGAKWLGVGMAEAYRHPGEAAAFVFSRSDELKRRSREFDADIAQAWREMRGDGNLLQRGVSKTQAWAMWGIGFIDVHAVAVPTWLGAYHRGIAEGMSEDEAAAYGDKAVRRSQSSGRAKDLAAFQAGGEGWRVMAMFYSYFNVLYNQQIDTIAALKRGEYRKAANQVFWIMTVGPLMGALLTGDWPQEDEDWGSWAARKMFWYIWASVPFMRDIGSFLDRMMSGQYATIPQVPVFRALESLVRVGTDAVNAAQGDEVSKQWLKHLIEAPGYFLGLPTGQIGNTAQFLYDVETGEQEPEDAEDWVFGLAKGKVREGED